jgi:predicted nucleic acid-binding Zn finger protein
MAWVDRWFVGSHSSDREYTVARADDGKWGCSCPAWKFQRHKSSDGLCKHIREVQETVLEKSRQVSHIRYDDFFKAEEFVL